MAYHYDHILIRYGELSLKGKNRGSFVKALYDNVRQALHAWPALEYRKEHDRMYIYLNGTDPDAVKDILQTVYGISSFSLAVKTAPEMDQILEAVMECLDFETARTFKVAARRSDKTFPLVSDQINREVAARILKNTSWKVDVHNPDVKIAIEIHTDAAYIMTDRIPGAGGFPVGTGGKAMVLLSGGIDSPVAASLVMKRGVRIECIHFAAPPYTSEKAKEKVMDLARILSAAQGEVRVWTVPFTMLQLDIYKHCDESYAITIMRRMMMRIATGLAQKRRCLALATGESLGQVASQTLESMDCINEVTVLPILRPVVCMDKVEIIDIARSLGTYETSIRPYEDCCTIFTPKAPATRPRLDKCQLFEARWDWKPEVEACINEAVCEIVRPGQMQDHDDWF